MKLRTGYCSDPLLPYSLTNKHQVLEKMRSIKSTWAGQAYEWVRDGLNLDKYRPDYLLEMERFCVKPSLYKASASLNARRSLSRC